MKFKQEKVDTKLPLGPMIDAVFLLLCFFLVTTDFTPPEGVIDAPLPKGLGESTATEAPKKSTEARIKVDTVNGEPRFYYNDSPVTAKELLMRLTDLSNQQEDVVAIVDPAMTANFQHVVTAYSIPKEAGITRVLFPTRSLKPTG
jgi:biopolymer transport protein ExbD